MWTNDEDFYYNSTTRPTYKQEQGKSNMAEENQKPEENDEVILDAEVTQEEVLDAEVLEADEILDAEDEEVHEFDAASFSLEDTQALFNDIQDRNYADSQELTKDIGMMQLEETGIQITEAVQQLQDFATGTEMVSKGFMGKVGSLVLALPGAKTVAGAMGAIKEEQEKQELRSGNIKEAAEKLFKTLEDKEKVLMSTTLNVMSIHERRVGDLSSLEAIEANLIAYTHSEGITSQELFLANNTLIPVSESLIASRNKISQVEVIINSAQNSTNAITTLLPAVKANLLDDLAITAGLNDLIQFKTMFDMTIGLVNDIEEKNVSKVQEALLGVVDLNVRTAQTERLTRINQVRHDGEVKVANKMKEQLIEQNRSIEQLGVIKTQQLEFKSEKEQMLLEVAKAVKPKKAKDTKEPKKAKKSA